VAQDPPQRVLRSKKREAAGIPFGMELDPKRTRLDVQPPSTAHLSEGLRYAQDFAHRSVLIKNLPEICYRLRNTLPPQDDIITSSNLPELWSICKCSARPLQTLNDRQQRARFSEFFHLAFKSNPKDDVIQDHKIIKDVIKNTVRPPQT
jgi:hypothetical protein